ncbi:hypothetical protein [Synechococcus sp. CC9616]|uniref:hypothetical protein n=1 Tax=Synechococcus sp. CC9616 TaxID=110663 RepID=UPI0004BAF329|nr:hypothetical protein [Synechococcus sp. CC9616]
MNVLDQPSEDAKKELRRQRLISVLFQIGSIIAYAAIANFVIHALTLVRLKVAAELSITLYALLFCIQQLLQLAYKWDKFWLRIQSSVLIIAYGFVFVLYVYTRTAPGFTPLSGHVAG